MIKKITISKLKLLCMDEHTSFSEALAAGFSADDYSTTMNLQQEAKAIRLILNLKAPDIIAITKDYIYQPYPDGSIGIELGHVYSKYENGCSYLEKDLILISTVHNDHCISIGTLAHELYHIYQYKHKLPISEDDADAFAVSFLRIRFASILSNPDEIYLKNSVSDPTDEYIERIKKKANSFFLVKQ